VVSLTPLALALFLAVTQPGYMRPLLVDPLGQQILAVGMVAWSAGAVWFQRLTKFDF
jgi:Flp pilus assembly protein TadB